MKNFIEKLNDIYRSITSKKDYKPDTYAYETQGFEVDIRWYNNWNYNEIWDNHLMFLDDTKLDNARDVFLDFCPDINWNYTEFPHTDKSIFKADRFDLFALTDEMIKECFDGASFSEVRDEILDLDDCSHYHTFEDGDEEFYETDDFWFAFNRRTEEVFFGKRVTTLDEFAYDHHKDEDDEYDNED